MEATAPDLEVRHDRERGCFEVSLGGTTATLDVRYESRLVLGHTDIPAPLDGPGHAVGAQLLRAAIARARADRATLVPTCSFARRWLRDNPDASIGVAIDWRAATPRA